MKHERQTLVGTGAASHRLGVSDTWIRKLARSGALALIVTGDGRLLFKLEDVERLATERQARAAERGRS